MPLRRPRRAQSPDQPLAVSVRTVPWPLRGPEAAKPFRQLGLSRGREPDWLKASVEALGLVRAPLAALDAKGDPVLLSGSLRIRALTELGKPFAPILFVPPKPSEAPCEFPPGEPGEGLCPSQILIAVGENLQRGYNDAEKAAAARLLLGVPDGPAKAGILGALGLTHPGALEGAARAASLPDPLLDALSRGWLDLGNIRDSQGWSDEERLAALSLFERLRPSRQNRRLWVQQLSDLKSRDKLQLAPFLGEAFSAFGSREEEPKAREALACLRSPKLAGILRKRDAILAQLELPKATTITYDRTLEDRHAILSMRIWDVNRFRQQIWKLWEMTGPEQWSTRAKKDPKLLAKAKAFDELFGGFLDVPWGK